MNKLPLPTNLPWELQLVFWVLMLLVGTFLGLAVWFLLRHINQQDTQFKDVKDGMGKQKGELESIKNEVLSATKMIVAESQAIKKSSLEFQGKISEEILTIKKDMIHIEASVDRTMTKAGQLEEKIDKNIVAVNQMNAGIESVTRTVDAHQKSLSMGAKVMHQQKEEISQIKTTIHKISENVFRIGEKKVKPDNGDGGKSS